MRRIGILASFAVALLAAPAHASSIELLRDVHGVVHVFADSDEGALYGAGYAAARDRLYQMHRTRRTVQGRLAELEGLRTSSGGATTVTSDQKWRRRRGYVHCQAVAAALDAATRTKLQAYADGVNAWIAESAGAGTLSPLFRGETPEPWTPADCLAVWNRIADYFASDVETAESKALHDLEAVGGDCDAYFAAHPSEAVIDEAAAVMQLAEVPPATLAGICAYAASVGYPCDPGLAPSGAKAARAGGRLVSPSAGARGVTDVEYPTFSHAWVVGGSKLAGGSTALVSDPQTAVTSPSIWYETHLKGATFDARGLTFAGCPGFLVGFSRDLAWGVTSLGIDLSDTYRLTTTGGGTAYVFEGQSHPIWSATDTIQVRQPGGGFSTVLFPHRWTALGPVVTELMQDVRPGEEYIVRLLPVVEEDRHTVQALLGMMAATNFTAFTDRLVDWRSPAVHMVLGDRTGQIAYWTLGAIPVRPAAHCLAGRASVPLADSTDLWVDTLPMDVRPHVVKPLGGALYSANHVAVGAWYPIPLLFGTGGSQHGERGWRLHERLVEDAPPTFTDAMVRDVHYDDVNPSRRTIVRAGLHLRDEPHLPAVTLSANALAQLAALESWYAGGAHGNLGEPKYAGALAMNLQFRSQQWPLLVPIWGGNNLSHMLKDFEARLDAHTPAAPAHFTPDEIAYVNGMLANGYTAAVNQYGPVANWPAAMQAAYGTRTLPYFQTIEGYGTLDPSADVVVSGLTVPDGATIRAQYGQSMTQYVSLAYPDRSQALLPIGKSENPASPFYTNEQAGWVGGALRASPLSRAAVEAMLHSTTTIPYGSVVDAGGPAAPGARVRLAPGHPGRGGVALSVTLPTAQAIVLEVYAANGRRLARRVDPVRPTGTHRVTWEPAGAARPAGVVFVRVAGEGWTRDLKAVMLPR